MKMIPCAAFAATLIVLAAPLAAQSSPRLRSDTALASLVAAENAFSEASRKDGAQAAFLRFLTADALLYRPKVVKAHAFLKARAMPPELLLLWEPIFADVSRAGDLGYTTGPWISQRRDAPQADPSFGQYVTIWQRQADRTWKAVLDAGIAHGADPVGPRGVDAPAAGTWQGTAAQLSGAQRSMMQADSVLNIAAGRTGAATAMQQRAAPHMRLLRMGREPMQRDSAFNFLRAASTYTWRAVGGGMSASGDLGYVYGVYAVPVNGPGRESGDYLRIWRRNAAGEWQVVLDLTSPEAPVRR
jgi:ketosteroid isomerase-like protein